MIKLTAEQQKIFNNYKKYHPKLSDEKIISVLVQSGQITLTQEQKNSILTNQNNQSNDLNSGLKLEKTTNTASNNGEKVVFLQSGRKVVVTKTNDGKDVYKYYAADGTQLNPDYFKKVEGQISISEDGKKYTITKNGKKTTLQAKDPSKGAIDQNLARLNNEEKRLKKTKNEQGFIGSSWDWIKNKTGIGDGSDKAQKQIEAERNLLNQIKTGKISKKYFKEVTGVEYSQENLEKFKRGELSQVSAKIDGYKEGQEMASDVAGDMISGIAAVGIYTAAVAAAPFTGGASIAVGVAAATASGALIKAGVKALDTVGTDRKYTLKDFGHDSLTGGFSGLLAPITGGMGGAVGKTVATKLGIQAVKQVGKEVAEEAVEQGVKQGLKQGLKTALTNPTGYEYVGGTLVKRGTALAAEMATDGALGGAIDGGFRAGLDNDWDANAILSGTIEGGIGGAIMAPIIGGGMKAAGKGAQKIFGKNNVQIDANGNIVRVNDDGTIRTTYEQIGGELKPEDLPAETPNAKAEVIEGVEAEQPKVHNAEVNSDVVAEYTPAKKVASIEIQEEVGVKSTISATETPIQAQKRLLQELQAAKTREDFARITQEIKELPKTEEFQAVRERLGGEHMQKYKEWKASQPESTRTIVNIATESTEKATGKVVQHFTTTSASDIVLSKARIDFEKYLNKGLPLKYSRNEFISELDGYLSKLNPIERAKIESEFGISFVQTGFNTVGKEIEGVPMIPKNLGNTEAEQKVAMAIRRFTQENEVQIADKEVKELLESVMHEFPEFTMVIGKKQHHTHDFSVDIHTLKNLQDNLANPKYAELDAESQLVLKYATILHDFGKRFLGDRTPDGGHARLSTEYAEKILERFDLSEDVKARIIKQVKNHHWFETYNKGKQTPEQVARVIETFGTKEDFAVAEIMAKSDFENVNKDFHLDRRKSGVIGDGLMSKEEYETFMTSSFEKIEHEFVSKNSANIAKEVTNAELKESLATLQTELKQDLIPRHRYRLENKYKELRRQIISEIPDAQEKERALILLDTVKEHLLTFDGEIATEHFAVNHFRQLANIKDFDTNRFIELMKNYNSTHGSLLKIMKMPNEEFSKLKSCLIDKSDYSLLEELYKISKKIGIDEVSNRVKYLTQSIGTENLKGDMVYNLTWLPEEAWNNIKTRNLTKIINNKNSWYVSELAQLSENEYLNAVKRNLLNAEDTRYLHDIIALSDAEYEKLINLNIINKSDGTLNVAGYIQDFLNLTAKEKDRLKILCIDKYPENNVYKKSASSDLPLRELLRVDDSKWKTIVDYKLHEPTSTGRRFNSEEILTLLSQEQNVIDKTVNNIIKLFPDADINEIISLAKLSDKDFAKVQKFNLLNEKVTPRRFGGNRDELGELREFWGLYNIGDESPFMKNTKIEIPDIIRIVNEDEKNIPHILRLLKHENATELIWDDISRVSKLSDHDFNELIKIMDKEKDCFQILKSVIDNVNGELKFNPKAYDAFIKFEKMFDGNKYLAESRIQLLKDKSGAFDEKIAEKYFKFIKDYDNEDLASHLLEIATNNKEGADFRFFDAFIDAKSQNIPEDYLPLILEQCTDAFGRFDKNIYNKIFELQNNELFPIVMPQILKACKNVDGTFNEMVYKEVFKLKNEGYGKQDIGYILQGAKDLYDNFSPTILNDIKDLYGFWTGDSFAEIIKTCIDEKGVFNKDIYDKLVLVANNTHHIGKFDVVNYKDLIKAFANLEGVTNINELSITEKRKLFKNLIAQNNNLFGEHIEEIYTALNIKEGLIPKNQEEYCALLPKLLKSIGIDSKPLARDVISNYHSAMDNILKPNGALSHLNLDSGDFKVKLQYPREEFIKNMQELLSKLSPKEQNKAMDYFGFELKNRADGIVQLNGYPLNVNNGAKMSEISDPATKNIIEQMRPLVEKFTNNNQVIIENNKELSQELNQILKAFPELLTTFGKKQEVGMPTAEIQILKTLQNLAKNTKYQNLTKEDKKIVQVAALLQNISKAEGLLDITSPQYSAYDSYYILEKFGLSDSEKVKIYQLIKNQDMYNSLTGIKETAFNLRAGNSFELASILADAKITSTKDAAEIARIQTTRNNINNAINELKRTSILLPQTKIPKASALKLDGHNVRLEQTTDKNGNVITNTVIRLKKGMDLSQYGFEDGLIADDLNVLVHALDYEKDSAIFQALGQIDSDALLSSSYITYSKGNYHVFRTQGFILDIASSDIHAGTYKDFGSGCGKNLEGLMKQYLFGGNKQEYRTFMSEQLKSYLGLTDSEYVKLYSEIADKSISEIDKSHPFVAKKIREIFESMEVKKRSHGRDYNEMLISRPKIQAVFWQGKVNDLDVSANKKIPYTIDRVPEFLRKYAEEHDLPIIYFGE